MSAKQAREQVGEKFQAGLISLEEAKTAQNRISQIVYMKISQKQKESLYAIWAN